jgi:NAD(P)-dependent dehydrogenase (short-subunit alcohol dehydrogenase family)
MYKPTRVAGWEPRGRCSEGRGALAWRFGRRDILVNNAGVFVAGSD